MTVNGEIQKLAKKAAYNVKVAKQVLKDVQYFVSEVKKKLEVK